MELTTYTTPNFAARLVSEARDLKSRIDSLSIFLSSPNAGTLTDRHLRLLEQQSECMREYYVLLEQQIALVVEERHNHD